MPRTAVFILAILTLVGCSSPETEDALIEQSRTIFGTVPSVMPGGENDTPALVSLGAKLYSDTILSSNRTQSCATCHPIDGQLPGADNVRVSLGAHGTPGTRNSPSVLNAGFHATQFWDGRAKDLEEQAAGPILNPVEMAMPSEDEVVARIHADPTYKALFASAFRGDAEPVSYRNVARAIAAFERTLITTDRFDRFQKGDSSALTTQEREGLQLFVNNGCIACHRGPMLGGQLLQKVGLVHPYDNARDLGRYDVTKRAGDKYVFKVPALRNVGLTPPYFHDGAIPTLEAAVDKMAWMQLDRKLTNEETASIAAFLHALSDERRVSTREAYLHQPQTTAREVR